MKWVRIIDRIYNLSHLQEFYWREGKLFVHLLGRSVPDIISDPDQTHWRGLIRICEGGL